MSLRNAFAHLTALRIPPRTRVPLHHSLHYFPWIGMAQGSVNILAYLAAERVLPTPLACLFAVLLPQLLGGFGNWRGAMEAVQGRSTAVTHAFTPGFRPDWRGTGAVALIVLAKWSALWMLPPDWRVRAVLAYPVLGMSARTFLHLRDPVARAAKGLLLEGRRVRAGFLSAALLFLIFLFPLRAALPALAAGALAVLAMQRVLRREDRRLSLQAVAASAEAAEVALLLTVVAAGLLLY